MKLAHAIAVVAAIALAGLPGAGAAGASEPWGRALPQACTPELQRCLEKLEARLIILGRTLDAAAIDQALLELHQTDPECALQLEARLNDL
jgi:hypothetical protein